ncbi:hypothetical protein [Herbiconiux flava]|uniref:HK97 gp10 family phage protein n=1 Tax=Herbiconiux flava TaxID=881268 RepID=A0A852SUI2_9MICO|nr:hypothetical protein [Herbiconiux flava]NYD72294.1 hypothetical protein [Herbiconiux flava]GLK17743.1 hypothetical protein GCM10017602_22250 [Herbiconiux flava]
MIQIDAMESRELQALVLSIRRANKAVQGNIRRYTKERIAPEWQRLLAQHAETRLEHRVLVETSRVAVSNQNIKLKSATVGRSLSGGLKPSETYYAAEFGANRNKQVTYQTRSRKGKAYTVTRRTTEQLRLRRRQGYVVYQAAADIIPRIAALWAQTAVRTFRDGLEGKS